MVVMDIADLVRREGSRVYSTSAEEGIYHSMLCGLTVSYGRGGVVRAMKAHDIDLSIRLNQAVVEQDDGIERKSPVKTLVSIQYIAGNDMVLAAWHRHLCAYRQSMRSASRENFAA